MLYTNSTDYVLCTRSGIIGKPFMELNGTAFCGMHAKVFTHLDSLWKSDFFKEILHPFYRLVVYSTLLLHRLVLTSILLYIVFTMYRALLDSLY